MKQLTLLAALGFAAIGAAQVDYLQSPTNLAFRLGYVYPVDSALRDVANSYIGFGVDIFTNVKLLEGAETSISFDWFGKSGSGAKGNAFPILLNQRWYVGDDLVNRTYYYAGVGFAIIDVNSTKTVLAARIGAGKELGDHLFGEVNFTYSDAANGARATALGFYVGYRF